MEILAEVIGQVVFTVLSATVGVTVAAVTYWLWLNSRRSLWGLDQVTTATTPRGEKYSLEIPMLRVRTPVSRRLFRSRTARGEPRPEWTESDRLHPMRVAGAADEMLILVAPVMLFGVAVLVILFALEFLIAVLVMSLVSTVATIIRHRWTCVVTGPGGSEYRVSARGLRRVRRLRDELAEQIARGDLTALYAVR